MFSALVRGWLLWLSLQLLWMFFFLLRQQLLPDVDLPIPAPSLLHRRMQDIRPRGVHSTTGYFQTSAGKASGHISTGGTKRCCAFISHPGWGRKKVAGSVSYELKLWQFGFCWCFAWGNGAEAPCESSRLQAMFVCLKVKESYKENK